MGRKSKKEGIYLNVWLIHLVVQQKLTQQCKATISQSFKKKNGTNEFIQKMETDSQTEKTNLRLPKEKGGEGGIKQEFRSSRYKLLYIK